MSRVLQVSGLGMPFDAAAGDGVGLEGIDFALDSGQVLGVVGESGSGKTTLARALAGLRPIRSGSIQVMGEDLLPSGQVPGHLRHQVQMVFQDPLASLNPRMSVGAIIAEPLRTHHPDLSQTQIKQRVQQMMERVGLLPNQINRYPHEFSGGQLQRIAIARALAVEPELIICDEPTSALDRPTADQMALTFRQLAREKKLAIIFVTHDLRLTGRCADHVIFMANGAVVEEGPANRLLNHPQTAEVRAFLASGSEDDREASP